MTQNTKFTEYVLIFFRPYSCHSHVCSTSLW